MGATLKDVSIVIVTYKGDGMLKDCLDSLAATCGDEPQIVVVDNSPSEATRFLVARYPNTCYVSSPGNPGFAGGNNRAMPFCERPYVLLLNNDTIVHERASIEALVAFLDETPQAGVVQGTMVVPGEKPVLGGCGAFLSPFGFLYANGAFVPDALEYHSPCRCFSAIGAFMMFRKSLLAHTNGFLFRSHFWSYYEETDFCHRVWLVGSEVWYVPTPPISHLLGKTSGMFPPAEIMGRYLRNQLFSLAVNLGWAARLWLVPAQAGIVFCHALVSLARGNAKQFRSDTSAIAVLWRERKRILAARRAVQRKRKIGDLALFRAVMRMPPPGYFLRSLKAIK